MVAERVVLALGAEKPAGLDPGVVDAAFVDSDDVWPAAERAEDLGGRGVAVACLLPDRAVGEETAGAHRTKGGGVAGSGGDGVALIWAGVPCGVVAGAGAPVCGLGIDCVVAERAGRRRVRGAFGCGGRGSIGAGPRPRSRRADATESGAWPRPKSRTLLPSYAGLKADLQVRFWLLMLSTPVSNGGIESRSGPRCRKNNKKERTGRTCH